MYDAIVVGARCAGSPTGMLLARKGYRVLIVDRASFPSDTISTHMVWPRGCEALSRWGLLDNVIATGCPNLGREMLVDFGPFSLRGSITEGNGGRGCYCPRRAILDQILVDAAIESGAEVRERFTVESLVSEEDRVAGIRAHSPGGQSVEERARIVIGADGIHSFVAKSVGALEYNMQPPLVNFYYSYFSGYPGPDAETWLGDHNVVICFPTNHGLTLVSGGWPSVRFPEIRADIDGNFEKLVQTRPVVCERMEGTRREDKWYGTAGVPNYFRKPYGPGWALVGDAAYDRDPITAQGISDAFIEAEHLSDAIDAVFSGRQPWEEALPQYEIDRNARVQQMYVFTCQLGTLAPQPPPMMRVLEAMQDNPEAIGLLYSAIVGSVPVTDFMNPDNFGKIVAEASAP